ncbi:MAG: hypothetical protein K0Q52_97 [Microbacterium sp.]|jgi:predicted RecA/RadA family phage recombinase|nr:hypothetical protein [Microbacterium sp.]
MSASATKARATQAVFSHTHLDGESTIWDVPAGTESRTLVRDGDTFAVTLTRAPGGTGRDELAIGPFKVSREQLVGVSNEEAVAVGEHAVGVTPHGTWEFEGIVGATVDTPQSTPVYVEADGDLTVTEGTNTRVGVVNYPGTYTKVAGTLPIKIGA